MVVSKQTLDLLKTWEGFREKAYQDERGIWTIGYGFTTLNGKPVKQGMQMTRAAADYLLVKKAEEFQSGVMSLVKVPVNENQISALVSFSFNCGLDIDADTIAEGLGDSTLLSKLNHKDYVGAANEFLKWSRAGDHQSPGLVRRRNAERLLFLKPVK